MRFTTLACVLVITPSLAAATAGCGAESRSAVLSTADLTGIVGQPPQAVRGEWTPWQQFKTRITPQELRRKWAPGRQLVEQGLVALERRAWNDGVKNARADVYLFEDADGARSGMATLRVLMAESFEGDGTVEVVVDEIEGAELGDAWKGWHEKGGDEGFFYLWRRDNAVFIAFMQSAEGDLSEPEQVRSEAGAYANAVDYRAEAISKAG